MASVPAELSPAGLPATVAESGGGERMIENRSDLLLGFNRLSLLRQLVLMVGAAASIALGIAIILWANEPDYRPLFNDMAQYDGVEVTGILQQHEIKYRIEPNSGALLVAAEDVHKARMQLASMGITQDRGVGFELLDKETGLGTSQFMESTRYRRGLEGELARTISSLRNVKNARVHLAIPKDSVFVRDHRKATASVLLELNGTRVMTAQQVEAIVNLVAGSVPQMSQADVTVVDQSGNLLSGSGLSEQDKQTSREFEYARRMEEVLTRRVNGILDPVIGANRFRAEVSADIDFTAVEQAEEIFNPEQQAIRSIQESGEQRGAGQVGGIPGALSNQPPGAAQAPEQAAGGEAGAANTLTDIRKESIRNFEVDRTVSYTKHHQGKIQRLTVAVVVDDIRKVDPQTGAVTFQPWPAAELERLAQLVKDAVGFSAARGDSVNVINTPFLAEELAVTEVDIPLWEQAWFRDVIKWSIAFLIVLVLVFGVIRPTFKNLLSNGASEKNLALAGDEDGLAELEKLSTMGEGDVGLSTAGDFLLPGASEGYEKQKNALKGLIAEDPGRVAQVVRQWIMADE